jgi:hypothetical protein
MVADELRRQADVFVDLLDLKTKIGRDMTGNANGLLARNSY